MNSKKKDFLISISIVFIFTLIIVLYVNYVLISLFGLNQENFIYIIIPLLLLALGIFLSFTSSILKPLFTSDDNLQKNLKETIHELNIPVSTIKMNTQLLEKSIKDEKSLKRLNRIKQASNNLIKLYDDMEYDIKKEIDVIDKQECFLDEIIANSINKFDDIKKDVIIKSSIPNIKLLTDINGFEKTIDNLILNAIKYNSSEDPIVEITFENNILSIFNKGKKIDTKNLLIIFDRYYQSDSSSEGFGLGLNIVKEFCDKNKIVIKIDTFKDGNTFNLNIKNILK
ncbi:histidine kinase [Poseidonibacter parvus]|uniref:histidine kinase n=1 Tax=Poseidonibacter parvus TaxID=1850254 RepID=A0A1P8KML7_9BACT|nr:HAMP domain-containing sensor histidine kinase [Poseidonibacter parvus]APW65801.1 histidine kinase [Poseidonibacter parvus]